MIAVLYQQYSKEPDTKKQNNHNHRTNNLAGNTEAIESNRQQHQANKILQLEQEQQQRRDPTQLNSKEKPLQDQVTTRQKKNR